MALSLQAMINNTGLMFAIDGTGSSPISIEEVAPFTEIYETSSGPFSLEAIADDQNYNY